MLRAIADHLIRRPDSKIRNRLLGIALRRIDGQAVTSRYGVQMAARGRDWTNFLSISGIARADYDDVFAVVRTIRPGMAFFDIGANAGLFSMVAGQRLGADGRIVAFEPSLPIFRDLVGNAVANRLTGFFPFNAAIGRETGTVRFSAGAEGHSGGAHLDEQGGGVTVAQIDFVSLWPLIGEIIGQRPVMIKIDVEGAEDIVLGAIAPLLESGQVETCIVEIDATHLRRFGATPADVYARMAAAGLAPQVGLGARDHYNEIFVRR